MNLDKIACKLGLHKWVRFDNKIMLNTHGEETGEILTMMCKRCGKTHTTKLYYTDEINF